MPRAIYFNQTDTGVNYQHVRLHCFFAEVTTVETWCCCAVYDVTLMEAPSKLFWALETIRIPFHPCVHTGNSYAAKQHAHKQCSFLQILPPGHIQVFKFRSNRSHCHSIVYCTVFLEVILSLNVSHHSLVCVYSHVLQDSRVILGQITLIYCFFFSAHFFKTASAVCWNISYSPKPFNSSFKT